MREIDSLVMSAKSDPLLRDKLLKQHEFYILKCASKTTHRFVSKSDDEWSIALLAFSQAIDSYDLTKGSYLKFAELVIKRRLIDYSKSQLKYNVETSVDPITFDTEPEDDSEDISIKMAVAEQVSRQDNGNLKLEIEEAGKLFKEYGFSFFDLSECSPHAEKTRRACAKAVNTMLMNPFAVSELRTTRQLPLKMIEKNSGVPRKILERHRKYIIAAIEILSGDYPYLAEYMRYIREEKDV